MVPVHELDESEQAGGGGSQWPTHGTCRNFPFPSPAWLLLKSAFSILNLSVNHWDGEKKMHILEAGRKGAAV